MANRVIHWVKKVTALTARVEWCMVRNEHIIGVGHGSPLPLNLAREWVKYSNKQVKARDLWNHDGHGWKEFDRNPKKFYF